MLLLFSVFSLAGQGRNAFPSCQSNKTVSSCEDFGLRKKVDTSRHVLPATKAAIVEYSIYLGIGDRWLPRLLNLLKPSGNFTYYQVQH
jgi:ABC-type microcin C transport system permease subunit YejE